MPDGVNKAKSAVWPDYVVSTARYIVSILLPDFLPDAAFFS